MLNILWDCYMKLYLFLGIFLLLTHSLFALNITATSQPSTCSANGSALATASGGVAPYIYIISGGTTNAVSPSVSGAYNFTALPSGTYTITVTDNNSATASTTVTVGGNYQEPTLTCSVAGCTITATAALGLAPFTYAISYNNGATFSTPQSSNVFNNLPNGFYIIRVYDACQNFYPCYPQVNVTPLVFPTYSCTSAGGMDNITLSMSSAGGAAPYLITCVTGNNTSMSNSGVFSVAASCDHFISIIDACGNTISDTITACNVPTFGVEPICRNCELGTMSVQGVGGSPPYTYSYNMPNGTVLTNNTGSFTGLPPSQTCYVVTASDACGRKTAVTASCMKAPNIVGSGCPWTGIIDIDARFGPNCGMANNVFPMTATCTSVTPNISITQNSGFFHFTGLPYGSHTFTLVDGCGEMETTSIDPIPLQISLQYNLCDSLSATTGIPNTTYTLWDSTGTIILAVDTSGTFGGLQLGNYQISAYNAICDTQKTTFHVQIDLQVDFDCNVVSAKTCPEDSMLFELWQQVPLTSTWILVHSAFSNIGTYDYNGLASGMNYYIHVLQTSSGEMANYYFTTPQLSATTILNCNDLGINVIPFQSGNVYTIIDLNGNLIATDTVAHFDDLPGGNFTLNIIHAGCDTIQKAITIPNLTPTFCLVPSSYNTGNGICEAGWDMQFSQSYISNYGPFTLTDSLGDTHPYCSSANSFSNLFPGTYILSSNCVTDTLKVPLVVVPNFQVSAFAECPNLGKVTVSGYFTPAQWDSIENVIGYNICPYNYFIELYQNGMLAASSNALAFPSTNFSFLQLGVTYTVRIYPYPPYYPCGTCAIDTFQVVMPYYAQPDLTATYGAICGSATTGSITANVAGGTPPFTYQIISPPLGNAVTIPNNSYTFPNLNTGSYTILVNDKCGISSDYSSSVGPLAFVPQYVRYCNGTLQLQVPNISGATYNWQNTNGINISNIHNPIIPDLGIPQSFIVTVSIGGCSNSNVINIPMQTGVAVVADAGADDYVYTASTTLNAVSAPANATGTWTQISPSSGNTNFGNVNDPNSSITVSQFPGTYTYVWTVTGATGGCTDKDTVVIHFVTCTASNPMNLNVVGYSPTCGGNNGNALANLTGGLGPFSYSWNNGCTTAYNTGISAGSYSVTVTDLSGCFPPVVKYVYIVPTINVNGVISNQTNLLCYGDTLGTATALATQGTAPFQYSLDGNTFGSTNIFIHLNGGAHNITIKDANGCSKLLSFNILEPDSLEISLVATNISCNAANAWTATANVSGGTGNYTYSWDNGQTTNQISNLPLGTYTVFVSDSNHCTKQKSITIVPPVSLNVNVLAQTNILCYGANTGSISVGASGGQANYTYSWDNGLFGSTINNLSAGTYVVYLADANNCTASNSITLTQANPILVDNISTANVSCFGGTNGSAQALASGGTGSLSYSWSNGNLGQNATNLSAGTSILYVTDANNCQILQNVPITQPPAIALTNANMDSVNCAGTNTGALSVSASGGTGTLIYSWNTGHIGQNLNNVGVGNYNLLITDANNCQFSQTLTVLEPLPLQLSTLTLSNACDGAATGSAQVSVSGGTPPFSYSWNNGQTSAIATNLAVGTYKVWVTDAKGCKKTATISIISFQINLIPQNVSCFGGNDGAITVNASGGVGNYHYSWDNGQSTQVISNLLIGTYKVWVWDTTTCILNSSINITQPLPLHSLASSLKMIDCFGANTGNANININGGTAPYSYSWNPSPVQITANATGILAHHLKANTYNLWITDAHQCIDSLEFIITESPAIKITIAEIEKAYCNLANGNALVNASGGNGNFTYSWNTIPSQDSNFLQNVLGGVYKVYVTDEKGCRSSWNVSIPNVPPPTTFFTSQPSNNVAIFEYDHLYFHNESLNAYSYSWNFGDNSFSNAINPEHIYEFANTYTVTLIGYDEHKVCPTTFSMTYFISPDGRIFIPSAFSPNGDNTNDVFFVMGTGIIELELIIFDRWGKVITTLHSPAEVWDGLDKNGKPCPEGAYTFKATALLNNGYRLNRGGTITLFR